MTGNEANTTDVPLLGSGRHLVWRQLKRAPKEFLVGGLGTTLYAAMTILASFVQEYGGQQVLAAPIDRGFNRLAWALPYAIGVLSLFLAGLLAVRWSRRSGQMAIAGVPGGDDAALGSRLDDELRDLD